MFRVAICLLSWEKSTGSFFLFAEVTKSKKMAHLLENMVAGTKLAKLIGEYFLPWTDHVATDSIQKCQTKACFKMKTNEQLA